MSTPGQGSDRSLAGPLVLRPVFPLAVSPTVVGLRALPRFRHLVVALAATKAPEGLDLLGFGFAGDGGVRLWVEPGGVRDSWFSGRIWGERLGLGDWSAVFITGAIRRPITEMLRLERWLDGMEVIIVVSPTFLALLFRVNRIPENGLK